MKLLVVAIIFFNLSVWAQTTESTTSSTSIGDFQVETSAPSRRWAIGTDINSFGASDIHQDHYGLKTTYRADHRFNVYLFLNRFSVEDEDRRRNWDSSGIGLDYLPDGSYNSGVILRVKTQNVEAQQKPFRTRISISSYGVGYQQILGRINLIFSYMMNASGYRPINDVEAPRDFRPGEWLLTTELSVLF